MNLGKYIKFETGQNCFQKYYVPLTPFDSAQGSTGSLSGVETNIPNNKINVPFNFAQGTTHYPIFTDVIVMEPITALSLKKEMSSLLSESPKE